ncbi:hypothetical protein [uncultured Martelella sp.]|uniref:hypothetical protein n=1 Tax=uncultured Martelella sp. TaxID=392331 RepID=UPI0029C8A311|nr:hypothetical protein [uncultured Martelella sp.]
MDDTKKGSRKSGRVLLWSVAAIAVIAAAGVVGGKVMLEKTVTTSLENGGAQADSVKVDFMGRVHMREVSVPLENGSTVHIASLEARPEFLFLSGMIDASDITFDTDRTHIKVPSLQVENAGLNRAFLAAATGENDLTPAERLQHLSAGRIAVSNVEAVETLAGSEQKTTYTDVVLNDVVDGIVGNYSISGVETQMTLALQDAEAGQDTSGAATVSLENIEGQNIDGPFLLRVYTEAKPEGDENTPHQVYGPMSAKNFVMETDKARVSYDVLRSDGFSMRLADQPVIDTITALQDATAEDVLPEEEKQRLGLQVLSLADVVAKGDIQISGIGLTTDEEPDMTFAIDGLAVSLNDMVVDLSLDGLAVHAGEDSVTLKQASWTDLSLKPTFDGIREFVEAGDDDALPETAFLPDFGTFRMTDYAIDVKPIEGDEVGFDVDEPINIAMKDFTLALKAPFNNIPTDIHMSLEDLTYGLADNADDPVFETIRQLGYETVTVSENIQIHWDRENEQLVVEDITLSGQDMGSVSLSGLIGGFNEAFFSGDMMAVQSAALGLSAHEVALKVKNDGLFARGLKFYAEQNDMSEAQAKLAISMLPSIATQTFGGDDPAIQTVVDALSAFVADPNTLEIAITAKPEQGIGMPAFMEASMDPTSLLKQVDITATAE